jgi:hypothetical protein
MWIIDRQTRASRLWNGTASVKAERLTVPDSPIHVDRAYLFVRLDASRTHIGQHPLALRR